jgi:transcriptional regulator with XRE-family HTH domain
MTDHDFLIQLGKRIATLRKAKGYSQLDLGSIIDMEKSNLSAIEKTLSYKVCKLKN